jgi:cytochrome c oxidase subunit 2
MHIHRLEKIWMGVGALIIVGFIAALGINAFAMGNVPPSDLKTIDPTKVAETPPFDKPGLVKIKDNEYDLNMTGFTFGYAPAVTEIPLGAKVNFHVTTVDVVHGFEIPGTNVNMMLLPGHVNSSTHTFDKPGEYLILCHEYCGAAHHMMAAKIVVQ